MNNIILEPPKERKQKFEKEDYSFEELLELDYKGRKISSTSRDKYFNYWDFL